MQNKLNDLYAYLSHHVRGQHEVLRQISAKVLRRELNTVPQHGPRGCFFFAGPTGVGKTVTAGTLAEFLFAAGGLVRFDCSEFENPNLELLLGNRDGDCGRFGEAYEQARQGVWLFDEFEKAHPKFGRLFLQMAGDARVTLANGEILDLRGVYLIATSNLGSAEILEREHLTFTSIERHVTRCIEKWLRPELLGRFGKPYVFRPLSREVQREIVEQRQASLIHWQEAQGRHITVDPVVIAFLTQKGFSRRLGARPLLDILEELVGNAIAENIRNGGTGNGRLIIDGDHLKLM